jgi:hypothetical protein
MLQPINVPELASCKVMETRRSRRRSEAHRHTIQTTRYYAIEFEYGWDERSVYVAIEKVLDACNFFLDDTFFGCDSSVSPNKIKLE